MELSFDGLGANVTIRDSNESNGTAGDAEVDGISEEKPWSTWRQPGLGVALLAVAYITVGVVGVLNNGLVIAAVFHHASMRTVTNYFLANLAVADILVCVFVLPATLLQNIYTGLRYAHDEKEWWYGDTVCRWVTYLQGVAVGASVNTLAAVAVERYLEVFHSTTAKVTTSAAVCVICAIWLVPMFIFVPWVLVYRQRVFDIGRYEFVACHADWPSPLMFRAFTVGVVFLTCYLLPLVCIGVFYALIGVRVWRRRVGHLSVQSRAAANIRRSKTRLLRMLVTIVVLFAASWLPLYAINLRRMFAEPPASASLEKHLTERYLGPLAQWLGASNSCVNPFVYCYFSHGFRSGVVGLLRAVFCRPATASESTAVRQRPVAGVDVIIVSADVDDFRRCRTAGRQLAAPDDDEIIALPTRTTQDIV